MSSAKDARIQEGPSTSDEMRTSIIRTGRLSTVLQRCAFRTHITTGNYDQLWRQDVLRAQIAVFQFVAKLRKRLVAQ